MAWSTVAELQAAGQLLWVERWAALVSVDPTDGTRLIFTKLAADMNGDGATTITDLRLWLEWAGKLPGDYVLIALMKWLPSAAFFLELGPSQLGSWVNSIAVMVVLLFWVHDVWRDL